MLCLLLQCGLGICTTSNGDVHVNRGVLQLNNGNLLIDNRVLLIRNGNLLMNNRVLQLRDRAQQLSNGNSVVKSHPLQNEAIIAPFKGVGVNFLNQTTLTHKHLFISIKNSQ